MKMNAFSKTAYTLLVIGGLNWALIGFFDYNLIGKVFSDDVARIIYSLVGLAALYGLFSIISMKSSADKKKG
ncbi:MAG: DUF378 domain-containing protein [Candidatus Saccharimonadales bacterium]